jgi:hypothetical protein
MIAVHPVGASIITRRDLQALLLLLYIPSTYRLVRVGHLVQKFCQIVQIVGPTRINVSTTLAKNLDSALSLRTTTHLLCARFAKRTAVAVLS